MNEENKNADESRRPLKSRDTWWAKRLAQLLAQKNVSPNSVSLASIFIASLAAVALAGAGAVSDGFRTALFLVAATAVQGRLLCNLLDGMVAIEGGKQTKSGAFYNEFPDRISDMLILAGFGLSTGNPHYGIVLGSMSAMAALLTSYVRALGASLYGSQDYSGPMAKQHRMAVVTGTVLLAALPAFSEWQQKLLILGNWIIILGSLLTIFLRVKNLLRNLERE